jgi:hypothetical protein
MLAARQFPCQDYRISASSSDDKIHIRPRSRFPPQNIADKTILSGLIIGRIKFFRFKAFATIMLILEETKINDTLYVVIFVNLTHLLRNISIFL